MESMLILLLLLLLGVLGVSIAIVLQVYKKKKYECDCKCDNSKPNSPNPAPVHVDPDSGKKCVKSPGYNPFNRDCCSGKDPDGNSYPPMYKAISPVNGDSYCLGGANCPALCDGFCSHDEGGIDQNCYRGCVSECGKVK